MSNTKKELEAIIQKLGKENERLAKKLDAMPKEEAVPKPDTISAEKLLEAVNGFHDALSELKYLAQKTAANSENRVLNKQYAAQLKTVNDYLSKLNVIVK